MDRNLLKILRQKQNDSYNNPNSILKKYQTYLESKSIYPSLHRSIFERKIEGHLELCEEILNIYAEVKLENERIMLLEDLAAIGYDNNKLVKLILSAFSLEPRPTNLWEYADLLYSINCQKYLPQYLKIIEDASYGGDRQMLILLVGKSKCSEYIPFLKKLLKDSTVYGHALDALSNFSGEEIEQIMHEYTEGYPAWICEIAKAYLSNMN